jgi:hypothetical protein
MRSNVDLSGYSTWGLHQTGASWIVMLTRWCMPAPPSIGYADAGSACVAGRSRQELVRIIEQNSAVDTSFVPCHTFSTNLEPMKEKTRMFRHRLIPVLVLFLLDAAFPTIYRPRPPILPIHRPASLRSIPYPLATRLFPFNRLH